MRSFLLLTALLLSSAAITPADARSSAPKLVVSSADLDLSRARDRTILLRRVDTAIIQVCGDYTRNSMIVPAPIVICRRQAAALAQPRVADLFARSSSMLASNVTPRR